MRTMMPRLFVLALLVLGLSEQGHAEQAPLDLTKTDSGTEVGESLYFLEDESSALGVQDVLSGELTDQFKALGGERQFSRTSSAYWFRLTVSNPAQFPLERLLVIKYPSHQQIDYFEVDDRGEEIRSRHRNAFALINQVDVRHRLPVYTMTVPAGQAKTLLIRIASPTIRSTMEVWEAKDFLSASWFSEWWFLVFLGLILAATIYSAVIAVASRSPLYISLFLVTVMMLCTQITMHGHAYQILGGAGGAFNYAWLLIQTWTAAALAIFSYIFLNGARMTPVFRYGLVVLTGAYTLTGFYSLFDYRSALLAGGPLLVIGALFVLSAAFHQVLRKDRDAVLYLVAWLPIMSLAILVGLNGVGVLGFAGLGSAVVSAWIPTTIFVFGFCVIFRTRSEHRESLGKSTFLAVLSHEVRTPLTGILGTVALLARSPLNVRQRRLVDNLHNSGNALLTLLDEVLQLSRFEAGRAAELTLAPADPAELARSMVSLMTARADAKGITVDFSSSGQIPDAVLVDEARLRQVLLNLISNAVKFTDEGQVHVEMAARETSAGHVALKFAVKDDGNGIASDKLSTLFEPYTQIEGPRREGTGLGLFISQQLVELMGGTISVKSEVGTGSCFSFEIDAEVTTMSSPAPDTKASLQVRADGERLLLVDDVAVNLEVIGELLSNAGFAVTTARSGNEALALFEKGSFDAVVLDAFMPGMSGPQVAEQLRAKDETCALLGLSASAEPTLNAACLASGMDEVLKKPADIELLTATLLELIASKGGKARAPILDTSALSVMRDVFGDSRCEALCNDAASSLREQLGGLETAFGHDDKVSVIQTAHRLAGIASNLGLARLGYDAEQLSASLRDGSAKQLCTEQLEHIEDIGEQSLASLEDFLRNTRTP